MAIIEVSLSKIFSYLGFTNATNGVTSFLGIPYTTPPTGTMRKSISKLGNLRFQALQPLLVNNTGVIQDTAFSNVCPQVGPNINAYYILRYLADSSVTTTTANSSEDYLVLNVYTPMSAVNGQESLPVLVSIRPIRTGAVLIQRWRWLRSREWAKQPTLSTRCIKQFIYWSLYPIQSMSRLAILSFSWVLTDFLLPRMSKPKVR